MSGGLNTGVAAAALKERGNDLYETPPVATVALLRAEDLPYCIWEPACGPGSIVRTLRESGRQVFASDLVDYDCEDSTSRRDFLLEQELPGPVEAIVTNPPFKIANEFVAHGLRLCPRVVMLLRLAFIESDRRRGILDGGHLARVHVFRNRLPMMHRNSVAGPVNSSALAFAWFVWDRNHQGPTVLNRISWAAE